MSTFGEIVINDFLSNESSYIAKVENELATEPLTYNQKMKLLETLLKRGLKFGIEKGVFLEQVRRDKIQLMIKSNLEKKVDEMMFDLNDLIMDFRNQPKIKYSKRKYRKRKTTRQLDLWEEFGFSSDLD